MGTVVLVVVRFGVATKYLGRGLVSYDAVASGKALSGLVW